MGDTSDKYSKPGFGTNLIFYFMREWLGDGIFTMVHGAGAEDGGHGWFVQRKIAAGIFSKSNFQNNMGEVFVEKSKRMVEVLQEPAAAGTAVDLQAMFFGFTMDSLMRIFFGEDASTLEGAVYADPEAVDPKRWIPFTAPEPYSFPVFQAGPRICLGMDMAIFEAKVAATSLLQKYRFELLEGEK